MCSNHTTLTGKTYPVKILYTATRISMLSSTGTRLNLNRPVIETPTLAWIMDHGKQDQLYTMELTADEMAEFKGLVQRQQAVIDYVGEQVKQTRLDVPTVSVNDTSPINNPTTVNLKPVREQYVTPTTYTNDKTGTRVTTTLSKAEIVNDFLANSDDSNWLWYWLVKYAEDRKAPSKKDMIAFLQDSFLYAIGMGLKRPMIRLHVGNRRYKIYLSKRGSLCFKGGDVHPETKDPVGDEEYLGCLYSGRFLVNKERKLLPEEETFLTDLAADPVGFMARTSKDMDRCCYCGKALEDKRSKDVGYGATCAAHWGLPWGKSYDEKVPSFAQLWAQTGSNQQCDIRAICQAIRSNPWDNLNWQAFGDALEESGHTKRPVMPARTTTVPAA